MAEATNDVHCIICLYFQKSAVIENLANDIGDIIGLVGVFWNHGVECITRAVRTVRCFANRCTIHVVGWEHVAQVTSELDC